MPRSLDSWITGNWGEDHPDNYVDPDEAREEAHRAYCRAMDREEARQRAWQWVLNHCDGIDNIGNCPVCGERIQVLGSKITMDGRLIGSCGDAFPIEKWEE
jgi:hypothetical protein